MMPLDLLKKEMILNIVSLGMKFSKIMLLLKVAIRSYHEAAYLAPLTAPQAHENTVMKTIRVHIEHHVWGLSIVGSRFS